MSRRMVDGILVAGMAALPFTLGITSIEANRVLILAGVYLVVSFLASGRKKPANLLTARMRMVVDLVMSGLIFAIAWAETFPAGDHTAEIGMYILCGIAVMAVALTAGPSRSTAYSSQ